MRLKQRADREYIVLRSKKVKTHKEEIGLLFNHQRNTTSDEILILWIFPYKPLFVERFGPSWMIRNHVREEDDATSAVHKKLFNQASKLWCKELLVMLATSYDSAILVAVTFGFVKCGQVRDSVDHFSMDLVLVEDA